ncbi:hypothetical protein CK203_099439 [Vitis vinifera]|uniref:Uncharacterized protein n=1 Tax=Vitis vinifera TaxID=29760 RepID=A0A438BN90_VITVI|nr:hypothetical protein CK203_099439 [Vitis vinifera]
MSQPEHHSRGPPSEAKPRAPRHPLNFFSQPWPKQRSQDPISSAAQSTERDHPLHLGQAPLVPRSQLAPPKKKARISAPVEPSKPQPPTTESQIPSGMTPEVIIRRPMVTQPPIEGNLDCGLGHSTRALF